MALLPSHTECKIFLENYSGVFFNGSTIIGRLECSFSQSISVRGIKIHLKCKEHHDLWGTDNYYDPGEKVYKSTRDNYIGDRVVFHQESILFSTNSPTQQRLPPGKYVYNFSLVLPKDIPSSFYGKYGSVYYVLKAVVDVPFAEDYRDRFTFMVKSLIDLNSFPKNNLWQNTFCDESSMCCCCCKGGIMAMEVEVPKIAFMPGEAVSLKIRISNLTNVNIASLKLSLQKHLRFKQAKEHGSVKEECEDVVNLEDHGVDAHREDTYDLLLLIPENLEVPNFIHCHFLEVSYSLQITGKVITVPGMDLNVYIYPKFGHIHNDQQLAATSSSSPILSRSVPDPSPESPEKLCYANGPPAPSSTIVTPGPLKGA